jgi:hypothetical protein
LSRKQALPLENDLAQLVTLALRQLSLCRRTVERRMAMMEGRPVSQMMGEKGRI